MLYLLVVSALLFPAQRPARGRVPEMPVPQGWTVEINGAGLLMVNHSSGASLRVARNRVAEDLQSFAQRAAERLANPLGFAQIGRPLHFSDAGEEWFQYEIGVIG